MRIISETRLRQFWQAKPQQRDAERPLKIWKSVVRRSAWKIPGDVKTTFGKNVDFVQSDNQSDLTVFNIAGNKYRLIAAIHFNRGKLFIRHVLTHAEYDEGKWKDD